MADSNMHAGFGIPLEYQTQLDALAQRRALAQALQVQASQPLQVPQYGRMASRMSPLAPLGQALAMYLNQKGVESADAERTKLLTDAQTEGLREFGDVQGMADPRARIAAAMVSRFPGIRQQGAAWDKEQRAAVTEGAKGIFPQDPTTAMRMLQTGQFGAGEYTSPPLPQPTFGQQGDNAYALVPQPGGKQDFRWAPKATNVNVDTRVAGQENATALSLAETSIKERRKVAQESRHVLDSVQSAYNALSAGATTGGGEGIVQGLRKAAQAFGITLPQTAAVDELRAALGEGVLAAARSLAPVTQQDVAFLEQTKGSVNTDPDALARMMNRVYAIAARDLQDYHRWLGAKQEGAATPTLKSAFAGEGIGLEQPPLTVPENVMVSIMQELQRRGGDVSNFTTSAGVPIRFQLSGAAAPQPRVMPPVPKGVVVGEPPARRR